MKPMTAETDLLPMPEWRGDFMTESEFREEAQAYARACVSSATEALRAEVAAVWAVMPGGARYLDPPDGGDVSLHEQVRRMAADAARAERLAEALREMLVFYGERVDAECRTKDWRELEAISAARAALEQEKGRE